MKIKSIFLTAVLAVASLVTSFAQNLTLTSTAHLDGQPINVMVEYSSSGLGFINNKTYTMVGSQVYMPPGGTRTLLSFTFDLNGHLVTFSGTELQTTAGGHFKVFSGVTGYFGVILTLVANGNYEFRLWKGSGT